jgi:uncharacterized protein (TIGR02246 family)
MCSALKAFLRFGIIYGLEETSMKMLLMTTTAFGLLTACTQAPPPIPDTRAADAQAIRDQETAAQQAWAAKDTDKVASLYADDATVMLPDTPVMTGKAAISAGFKGAGSDPNFALSLQTTSVDTSGDLGYVRGSYMVHQTDATSKKATMEKGNYVLVYKKQADGSWKIVADTAIPEAPAMPIAQ